MGVQQRRAGFHSLHLAAHAEELVDVVMVAEARPQSCPQSFKRVRVNRLGLARRLPCGHALLDQLIGVATDFDKDGNSTKEICCLCLPSLEGSFNVSQNVSQNCGQALTCHQVRC